MAAVYTALRCQHLDGSCQVVTQLFPKTCRTCLGLGEQIQIPPQWPDVGTSVPQVKSGHPPPRRCVVLWEDQTDCPQPSGPTTQAEDLPEKEAQGWDVGPGGL